MEAAQDRKGFFDALAGLIAEKTAKVREEWNTLEFTGEMSFLQNLKESPATHVETQEFSDSIRSLVSNPMFERAATADDKALLYDVIISRPGKLHFTALEVYLRATDDIALLDFYVQKVLGFEHDFKNFIDFRDPRADAVRMAFSAVNTLASKEILRSFAEMVLEMFRDKLPAGLDGKGGLLQLLTDAAGWNAPPKGLVGRDSKGNERPAQRRPKTDVKMVSKDNGHHRFGSSANDGGASIADAVPEETKEELEKFFLEADKPQVTTPPIPEGGEEVYDVEKALLASANN